jgi:hypothetical protein
VSRLGPRSLDEPRLLAGIDLLRRTGAAETQIRFHDDEKPVVWIAVAVYSQGAEAAGALDPVLAVLRLCEQVIDGGQCVHCKRPAGLDPDTLDRMPLDKLVCWYQYDPELQTFRRGCEGDT